MTVDQILGRLAEVAKSPRAQMDAYLKEGKKVVLTAPYYAPEEIVDAMGAVPMGAWGADIELNDAKKFFPTFICSIVQSIVELGVNHIYDGASALIMPMLCDSLKGAGQNFKAGVPSIPFIPMTYPQNRFADFGAKYCRANYLTVIAELEKALGTKFEEEKLAESIKVFNKHNQTMREFAAVAAKHPEISAQQRSDVFKSAMFMTKAEHTVLVRQLIDALNDQTPGKGRIPVYVSGILTDSPALNEIFDNCGMQIVMDDVAAQSRVYRTDAPEDGPALDCLVKKFQNTGNDSVLFDPAKKHVDFVPAEAKAYGAKGVVFVLTKFCDPEEFDYPLIKKECDAAGLPSVQIEIDRQMVRYEQARTILEAFIDVLS